MLLGELTGSSSSTGARRLLSLTPDQERELDRLAELKSAGMEAEPKPHEQKQRGFHTDAMSPEQRRAAIDSRAKLSSSSRSSSGNSGSGGSGGGIHLMSASCTGTNCGGPTGGTISGLSTLPQLTVVRPGGRVLAISNAYNMFASIVPPTVVIGAASSTDVDCGTDSLSCKHLSTALNAFPMRGTTFQLAAGAVISDSGFTVNAVETQIVAAPGVKPIIDCGGHSGFLINAKNVGLSGFVIRHAANPSGSGGALQTSTQQQVSLTIAQVDFQHSSAITGGALAVNSGSQVSLTDCTITDSTASVAGGGIVLLSGRASLPLVRLLCVLIV